MTELQKQLFALKAKYPTKKFASYKRTVDGGKAAIYYGTSRKSGTIRYELVPVSFKGDKSMIRNEDQDLVTLLQRDTGDNYVSIQVDDLKCPKCQSIDISSVHEYCRDIDETDPDFKMIESLRKEDDLLYCWSCGTFLIDATPKENR